MSTHYYNDAYIDASVDSASPLQLIHLAYESAIEAVSDAQGHLANGRIAERSRTINKAMKILRELSGSLDHKAAREMSLQLARLYRYMLDRLREANFRQIAEPLIEVEGLLRTLGNSWRILAAAGTEVNSMPEAAPTERRSQENIPWMPAAARSYAGDRYGAAYSL